MLGKESAMKWNTTTISANLLLKKRLPKWSMAGTSPDSLPMTNMMTATDMARMLLERL
jgi:hypothetical protein